MRGILDQAIAGLKPIFRTVFILRDVEELSTEETAESLGLSVAAVKSRLLRARLQLDFFRPHSTFDHVHLVASLRFVAT